MQAIAAVAHIVGVTMYTLLGVIKTVGGIVIQLGISLCSVFYQLLLGIWKVLWAFVVALRLPQLLGFMIWLLLVIRDLAYKYGAIIYRLLSYMVAKTYELFWEVMAKAWELVTWAFNKLMQALCWAYDKLCILALKCYDLLSWIFDKVCIVARKLYQVIS
jgi:hypothetical protein